MTKEHIIQNYKDGVYNKEFGDKYFELDLQELIDTVGLDYKEQINDLENEVKDLENEIYELECR